MNNKNKMIFDNVSKQNIISGTKRVEIKVDKINNKSADEMFKELGYIKSDENNYYDLTDIKYYKNEYNILYFDKSYKTFYKSGEYDSMCEDITMKELKAIYQKCQELGWI